MRVWSKAARGLTFLGAGVLVGAIFASRTRDSSLVENSPVVFRLINELPGRQWLKAIREHIDVFCCLASKNENAEITSRYSARVMLHSNKRHMIRQHLAVGLDSLLC